MNEETKEKATNSAFGITEVLQIKTSLDIGLKRCVRIFQVDKMEKGISGGLNIVESGLLLNNRW